MFYFGTGRGGVDEGATSADTSAKEGRAHASLLRVTTDAVDRRDRTSLMGDVIARELTGAAFSAPGGEAHCDWTLGTLAPGTVLGLARQGGFTGLRDDRRANDGDADLSIFFGLRSDTPFEQNDRRVRLAADTAVLVAHSRPVQSWWDDSEVLVLRLPRAALRAADRIESAGGLLLGAASPARRLLAGYAAALWPLMQEGVAPPAAARHLAELVDLALEEATGAASAPSGRGPGARAARLAAMREHMRRAHADPSLGMAEVAGAAGLSERAGYLLFEAAESSFAEELCALRLDRAAERLRGGYAGRLLDLALDTGFADASHFNRRFRRRFGATPSDIRSAATPAGKHPIPD